METTKQNKKKPYHMTNSYILYPITQLHPLELMADQDLNPSTIDTRSPSLMQFRERDHLGE